MFQKPNVKSSGNAVVNLLAVGAGVKVADVASAVLPADWSAWKNWALFGLGLVGAASVDTKKPNGDKAQMFFIGLAGKPLYNEITGIAKENVAAQDETTITGKIMNALVGHQLGSSYEPANDIMARLGNSADWSAREFLANSEEDMWSRAGAEEVSFSGV
ncbi:hypothetical protein [Flavobacterium sp.]|uniref:hypothetical protein n=1 Tax=Flavobacterium sp. TaxID=239 RepID=UPI00391966D5